MQTIYLYLYLWWLKYVHIKKLGNNRVGGGESSPNIPQTIPCLMVYKVMVLCIPTKKKHQS